MIFLHILYAIAIPGIAVTLSYLFFRYAVPWLYEAFVAWLDRADWRRADRIFFRVMKGLVFFAATYLVYICFAAYYGGAFERLVAR